MAYSSRCFPDPGIDPIVPAGYLPSEISSAAIGRTRVRFSDFDPLIKWRHPAKQPVHRAASAKRP